MAPDRRPIVAGLIVATLAAIGLVSLVGLTRPADRDDSIAVGLPAPAISGTTLDGEPFDLAALRGRPVIVNFWGPTCVPCRTEFPLLRQKLADHGPEGLAIVGVLMDDPPEPARVFVAEQGASWPTVVDPGESIRAAYRVLARPQSFFVDRAGILRSIQIGEVLEDDFDRQYATIAGGS